MAKAMTPEAIATRLMAPASTSALWTYDQVKTLLIEAAGDKMNDWQSIETAPKDGTVILVIRDDEGYAYPACWSGGLGWTDPAWDGSYDPTHWMPHPIPPGGRAIEKGESFVAG